MPDIPPEQMALELLLRAPRVEADSFTPSFLEARPLSRVQEIVTSLQKRYGACQRVRPLDNGGFSVQFDRRWPGVVRLRLNDAGQFDWLLFERRQSVPARILASTRRRFPAAVLVLPLGCFLILPLLWVMQLWRSDSALDWVSATLAVIVMLAWAYLIYPWTIISYWLRAILPTGMALAVVLPLATHSPHSWEPPRLAVTEGWSLVFVIIFGSGVVSALRGHRCPPNPLDLTFPLRDGAYAMAHGGSAVRINYHAPSRSQRYAVDVLKLDVLGRRARGIYPRRLDRYRIYNDVLYSPCDGVVQAVVGNLPDLIPPESDPARAAGNHVLLVHQGVKILLAHMQPDSVLVAVGDRVRQGQPLGRVGNSGNTSEPHLHIHAERGGQSDAWDTGDGVPMVFDGRFLCRNDIVRRRSHRAPSRSYGLWDRPGS